MQLSQPMIEVELNGFMPQNENEARFSVWKRAALLPPMVLCKDDKNRPSHNAKQVDVQSFGDHHLIRPLPPVWSFGKRR